MKKGDWSGHCGVACIECREAGFSINQSEGTMFEGHLVAIYIHGPKGEDLHRAESAQVSPERGIDGDRYCRKPGSGKPDQEITLIEAEAIEAIGRENDINIDPVKARRNLLTRGVPVNHLVG